MKPVTAYRYNCCIDLSTRNRPYDTKDLKISFCAKEDTKISTVF